MKKIYLLSAFALAFGSVSAQRSFHVVQEGLRLPAMPIVGERTPTDTLLPGALASGTLALYGAQGGGYLVGSNSYGDLAKAQEFILTGGPVYVEELAFLFGAKYVSGAANSHIMPTVWNKDGSTGYTTAGDGNQPCPGTVNQSAMVMMTDVDTANIQFVALDNDAYVSGDFIAGFDMSMMSSADTIGLVSSTDGDGATAELSWEKWSDGKWYTLLKAWPVDFDIAVWALVRSSDVGIDGNTFLNGMKMTIANNPVVENATILFELEKAADVSLEVIGMNGQKVFSADKGEMAAGRHQMDVNGLANGTYLVNLSANGRNLTKKLNVVK
jgi:hypothetical protein